MDYLYKSFHFGENSALVHEAGNPDCPTCDHCWPKRCQCGGLVHTQSSGSTGDAEWAWNEYACDLCGDQYKIVEDDFSSTDLWKAKPG